jgi:hypothetical protein
VLWVKDSGYFMYGTGDGEHGFAAYASQDLVHWKAEMMESGICITLAAVISLRYNGALIAN